MTCLSMFELSLTREILDDVRVERERQVKQEDWTLWHDDQHTNGEIACAAAAYALSSVSSYLSALAAPEFNNTAAGLWPWNPRTYKPKGARRDLIRAAALILAEIERIDRADRKKKYPTAEPIGDGLMESRPAGTYDEDD